MASLYKAGKMWPSFWFVLTFVFQIFYICQTPLEGQLSQHYLELGNERAINQLLKLEMCASFLKQKEDIKVLFHFV